MEALVVAGLQIQRGRISAIRTEGNILVEDASGDNYVDCVFLRTSASPPPRFKAGDDVLYICDETGVRGFVLGSIEPYASAESASCGSSEHASIPSTRALRIAADESIELRCGKSSFSMKADGRIVVKGTKLLSRSRGINKIKGAAVQIN